jgi:glyoxylase-like metal-dependent hydrolase (beta-lactamase superfamily II)
VRVERIAEGLWRWTAFHEEWRQTVGCVYAEADDAICLIDPLVPAHDRERFFEALDRDVKRLRRPVHVFVTVYWHTRSAGELAERYGATVWAHAKAEKTVGRRTGRTVRLFEPGDSLPGSVEAILGRWSEVVYWLPAYRTVVTGDVILGAPDGGLRFCPESWTPRAGGHAAWRRNLRPLLDLPVERVLVSHGEPVLEKGADALARILSQR